MTSAATTQRLQEAAADGDVPLNLAQVQGNVIGFQKDFQCFLLLRFRDQAVARSWVRFMVPQIATGQEVLDFNALFKRARERRGGREAPVKATWTNVGFTHRGLTVLAPPGLDQFPNEFKQGMRDAQTAQLNGDVNDSDPNHWLFPADQGETHALLIVASDSQADLDCEVSRQISELTARGVQLIFKQDGMARRDQPGHEHFGFDDGVSQPGIRDRRITDPDPGKRPAGQDRICPGDFVIGYPTQASALAPQGQGEPACGPISTGWPAGSTPGEPSPYPVGQTPPASPSPAWTMDGSYFVFRRLRQDVAGFRAFVRQTAEQEGRKEALVGAKMVGRYASGAPAEQLNTPIPNVSTTNQESDPGLLHPQLLEDDHINDFDYKGVDDQGINVPLSAHIRKVYPRNAEPPGEATSETRRILRRGIAYGLSFREDAAPGSPEAGDATFPYDRGLLFLCYQSSIHDKFEFLQRTWVNTVDSPAPGGGQDPIIGQKDSPRTFVVPGFQQDHLMLMQHWVITTGGDYFLAPSLAALDMLAGATA